MNHALRWVTVLGAVGLAGCSALLSISDNDPTVDAGSTPAGGATSTGRTSNVGGTTSIDGTAVTGGTAAGGTLSTGSLTSTDGTAANSGSTSIGGTAASGGVTSTSETAASGGDAGTDDAGVTNKTMFFGNISPDDVARDDFATYWNQIMPENVGKWGLVQPNSPDEFDWSALDAMYKYANDHNLIFKQHNFFCANQQPNWVTEDNVATAGPAWVKAFCERYPKTQLIDVVNEPSHYIPRYVNGMGGLGATGFDWVITAFKWARQYCPNAILIVNDFNIIEYDRDHDKFMPMIRSLLAAGAQIDAIGAQGHDAYKSNTQRLMLRIDDLATTGLPVYITEYDINLADDDEQMRTMADQIPLLWDDPNVLGLTYWGYVVGTTWRENAGLVNADGSLRPAMTWLQDFIQSHQ